MKTLITCCLLILVPCSAKADVSLSADAGRKIDSTQSSSLKKDKSLSVDKSQGRRQSSNTTRENTAEGSESKGHSSKAHTSQDNQNSTSYDINLNSMILQKFIAHYESSPPDDTWPKARYVFASCKPLTGLATEFPVLNGCPTSSARGVDMENIVPLSKATRFLDCGAKGGYYTRQEQLNEKNVDGMNYSDGIKDLGYMTKNPVNPQNPYVSRYARCRIIASQWVAEAAKRVQKAAPGTEEGVEAEIDKTFIHMDSEEDLFLQMASRAADLWSQAQCTPWLTISRDFQRPDMHCGVLNIEGDEAPRIVLQGRLTLNEASIEGRTYKLAVSTSSSTGNSTEDSISTDTRISHADRRSLSTDDYNEGKKTATLSKSKSIDDSQSSSLNQGSGNNVSASPEK